MVPVYLLNGSVMGNQTVRAEKMKTVVVGFNIILGGCTWKISVIPIKFIYFLFTEADGKCRMVVGNDLPLLHHCTDHN